MGNIKSVVIECGGTEATILWDDVEVSTFISGCCELCEGPETEVSFKCPVCGNEHFAY